MEQVKQFRKKKKKKSLEISVNIQTNFELVSNAKQTWLICLLKFALVYFLALF